MRASKIVALTNSLFARTETLTVRRVLTAEEVRSLPAAAFENPSTISLTDEEELFQRVTVDDLKAHRGTSAVIVGDHQPPVVHAWAHAINESLGNVGKTVTYTEPVKANPVNQTESLKDLVGDIHAGKVDALFILAATRPTMHPPILDLRMC